LLQTKGEVEFDWTVTGLSKLFFLLDSPSNLAQLQPSACHFQLIVGRGLQSRESNDPEKAKPDPFD